MYDSVTINAYRVGWCDEKDGGRYEQESPVPIKFTTIRKDTPEPQSRFSPFIDVAGLAQFYPGVELWCGKEQYRIHIDELSAAVAFLERRAHQ